MTALTPKQMLERVRACIAEAGYDPRDCGQVGDIMAVWFDDTIPDYICWKAEALVGIAMKCWPCESIGVHVYPGDPLYAVPDEPCGHPVDPFVREDAVA